MQLLTEELREELLENGSLSERGQRHDPYPVVKLFTPDANATWLLTELDPQDPDLAFGLCDLGVGFPELGYVRLSEIASQLGPAGLAVERDRLFKAKQTLSSYAEEAFSNGYISS